MFMHIPDVFLSPKAIKARKERERLYKEKRLKEAVAWDPKIRWAKCLTIKADTYTVPIDPFPKLKPIKIHHPTQMKAKSKYKDSPSGNWRYVRQIVPAQTVLFTASGSKRGDVMFDGDVVIPTLWHRNPGRNHHLDGWSEDPFMSITPSEIFTLRAGTRRAKGHTVVAGLGLGYQLMEVTKKKSVKKVTLIELDPDLVDWMLPAIKPFLGDCELEVIIGDANEVLPKLKADVALVDIYPGYGNKGYEKQKFERECKDIDFIWVWGSAVIG